MITITCEAHQTLSLSDMTEFQGGLKTRTESDYLKIQSSIRKYGIAFPFFVWKMYGINYVLDGHGRLGALERIHQQGEEVPQLPVVYIEADDEKQAKNLLLRLNSRYGEITADGIKEFLSDVEIDLDDVHLPEIPDISGLLNNILPDAPRGELEREYEPPKPKFELFCPECGEQQDITDDDLRAIIESNERLYRIWREMRYRCNNPNNHDYPLYGGK